MGRYVTLHALLAGFFAFGAVQFFSQWCWSRRERVFLLFALHCALCSALSERMREGRITVVDGFDLADHKTKGFTSAIAGLGHERKTLLVDASDNRNLQLSSRNVPSVKLSTGSELNIYDVLSHDRLIFSRSAIEALAARLGR